MEDVVVPQLEPSFDVDEEKTEDVVTQEQEQKWLETQLRSEVKNERFPLLRKEFEDYIEKWGNVSNLISLPKEEFTHRALAHAIVVDELKSLLAVIDQLGEVDSGDGSE